MSFLRTAFIYLAGALTAAAPAQVPEYLVSDGLVFVVGKPRPIAWCDADQAAWNVTGTRIAWECHSNVDSVTDERSALMRGTTIGTSPNAQVGVYDMTTNQVRLINLPGNQPHWTISWFGPDLLMLESIADAAPGFPPQNIILLTDVRSGAMKEMGTLPGSLNVSIAPALPAAVIVQTVTLNGQMEVHGFAASPNGLVEVKPLYNSEYVINGWDPFKPIVYFNGPPEGTAAMTISGSTYNFAPSEEIVPGVPAPRPLFAKPVQLGDGTYRISITANKGVPNLPNTVNAAQMADSSMAVMSPTESGIVFSDHGQLFLRQIVPYTREQSTQFLSGAEIAGLSGLAEAVYTGWSAFMKQTSGEGKMTEKNWQKVLEQWLPKRSDYTKFTYVGKNNVIGYANGKAVRLVLMRDGSTKTEKIAQ